MDLLITRADISNIRQISQTAKDSVINQHIGDAQIEDIQKLLGTSLFNDLLINNTDAKYQTLLNEGTYVYNGTTYNNYGLKNVLSLYSYAKYVLFGSQTDTPFGYVNKTNEHSTAVSYNDRKSMAQDSKQIAFNYWENVRDFLDRNSEDYPLWNSNCATKTTTFRITKIG